MSDNKPPMTVWLAFDAVACFKRNEDCGASDLKNHHHDVGPYVHMKQFMAEVERRANRSTFPHFDNDDEHTHKAMQELAQEIMEGKS